MRRILAVILFECMFTTHSLFGQCLATVEGNVVDETGTPVAGALVSFLEHGQAFNGRGLTHYETDSNGAFHAEVNLAGAQSFWVLAKKEEAGYPDTLMVFYAEHENQIVDLDCGVFRSDITVRIGPKVAYIRHISVVDEETKKPITNASITLRRLSPAISRLSSTDIFITRSTTINPLSSISQGIPVPSDCDISYVISAPGYVASPKRILHLVPSDLTDIEVQLRSDSTTQH